MPPTMTVNVRARVRRKRLAIGGARLAVALRPLVGARAATALANAAVRLFRVDYRIGGGKWRRMDAALPRITLR